MSTAVATKPVAKPVVKAKVAAPASPKSDDPIVAMLESYGFEYTIEVIDLSKVNRKQSRLNQARIDAPINEDTVILYGTAMDAGDKFPPIVASKAGVDYIVMDGNHRVAGADLAGITTLTAYVVKNATPAQITSFTYEANTKHGLPTSIHDRLRQAIYLVERGVPRKEAAARLKIPANRLQAALDTYQSEQRFAKLGNRKFDSLNPTAKRILDSIRSDDVLRPAATLVVEAGIIGQELTAFVKRVNEPRTERQALAVVHAERESRAAIIKATAGGRIPVPVYLQTLSRVSSTALNIDPERVLAALTEVGDDARAEYARAAGDAGTRLIELSMLVRRSAQG